MRLVVAGEGGREKSRWARKARLYRKYANELDGICHVNVKFMRRPNVVLVVGVANYKMAKDS